MGNTLRFVRPNVVRLALADGDWIDVKRELTAGEARSLLRDSHERRDDGTLVVDPANASLARLLGYIVDWSATDEDGKRLPVTAETLDALDVASFAALIAAVNAHEATRPTDAEATT